MKPFEDVLKQIAREEGISTEEVRLEMQKTLDYAYEHHNQETQPLWDLITVNGDRPTLEEFIFKVVKMIREIPDPL